MDTMNVNFFEDQMLHHYQDNDPESVAIVLNEFRDVSIAQKSTILKQFKTKSLKARLSKNESKRLIKHYNNVLVKRSALYRIAAAWVITVPESALLAAILYYTIRVFMMP